MLKLHYFPGSCAFVPHVALEWSGLPYQAQAETRESIKGEKLYENYAPHIPALEKAIAEGRTKIEELEQNMRKLTMWQEDAENLLKKMQPA